MGDSIDGSVIKKTQETLGKFVKKPPLSEKLLRKPPFRFLHDIVNVVIKDTGYLKGLFTPEELISDNIKDRDAKIKFLQSLIDVVKLTTNENLTARPSKIVAGQEPEKTNELLQAIGYAIEKKIDSSQVIDSQKNGGKTTTKTKSKPITKPDEIKKTTKIDRNDKIDKTKEKRKIENGGTVTKKPNDKIVKTSREKEIPGSKSNKLVTNSKGVSQRKDVGLTRKPSTDESLSQKSDEKKIPPQPPPPSAKPIENGINSALGPIIENEAIQQIESVLQPKEPINEPPLPEPQVTKPISPLKEINKTTVQHSAKLRSNSTDELSAIIDEEAERRRTEKRSAKKENSRKPSASESLVEFIKEEEKAEIEINGKEDNGTTLKPAPPPLQNGLHHPSEPQPPQVTEVTPTPTYIRQKSGDQKNVRPRTSLRPPSVRPASARPGAPRRRDKNIEIVLQPEELVKLGEIKVKIESFTSELEDDGENLIIIEDPENQSNDLLFNKSSKSIDGGDSDLQQQGHLVQQILETQKEFNSGDGSDSQTKIDKDWDKHRQSSAKQVDQLRDAIQKLTRSVNPLGKLLDFLQEDIDSMEREFEMWRDIYRQTKIDVNREKGLTENAIEPMKHQLAQIESNIKEYIEMIDISRANVLQNEPKIYKMFMDI